MLSKKKDNEKEVLNVVEATKQFNERVSRLLVVCLDGICQMIPQKETLHSALKNLGDVVKKATRPKPLAGMGKDIQDFFKRQLLEIRFRKTKNDTVKQIVLDLTETIQQIASTAGDFDHKMEISMEGIEAASTIEDILSLKEGIIEEIGKVREWRKPSPTFPFHADPIRSPKVYAYYRTVAPDCAPVSAIFPIS